MKFRYAVLISMSGLLTLTAPYCMAQTGNGLDNPDWVEEQIPPPPKFSKEHLIPIDMPAHVSVQVGVDPESILVGGDGVVRFVMVMVNASGNVSAAYEGIRCISDEVKTYARWGSSGQWLTLSNPDWKAVNDNMPSRHAQAFARQGACQNRLAPSKQEIIATLKSVRRPSQGSKTN